MPYRFIRRISNSMAEVATPDGHTIRLPYNGSDISKGSIVKPEFNKCCQPISIKGGRSLVPGVRSDTPPPRRIKIIEDRLPIIRTILTNYVPNGFLEEQVIPILYTLESYLDGFYLPFTSDYPTTYFLNPNFPSFEPSPVKLAVTKDLYCFLTGSFDGALIKEPSPGAEIAKVDNIFVVDAQADMLDYAYGNIAGVYDDIQQYHPGAILHTYRETDNRILPNGRLKELFSEWWLNPKQFPYITWPNY